MDINIAFSKISKAGFSNIEILMEPPYFDASDTNITNVQILAQKYGLAVQVGHSPIENTDCGSVDESQRIASIDIIGACFGPLAAIGVEIVVVHINGPLTEYTHQNRQASLAQSKKSLVELSQQAESADIKIAVENLPHHSMPRPGHSMTEIQELIADLPENVGLCLDVGHSKISGHDPVEELRIAASRLFSVHLQDVNGQKDCHWVPGKGIIDWDALISELDNMKFSGPRIIEVIPSTKNIDPVLKECYNLVEQWCK
jgi:sugar phosphate isomerase/epimerase